MWTHIEGDIEGFFKGLWAWIVTFFKDDIQPLIPALVALVEQEAVAYVTANPGAAFGDFLHAVYNAVKPQLTGDLVNIEDSAVTFIISGVAGKLGIPNVQGNQGLLSGGNQGAS